MYLKGFAQHPRMQTPSLLDADFPGCRFPWMQISLDADPLEADILGHVTCDACWEEPPTPLVDRMTDTSENIILPQTSSADGKYNIKIEKV